jgi:hypothetical protein
MRLRVRSITSWWVMIQLTFLLGFACGRYQHVLGQLLDLLAHWLQVPSMGPV